MRRSAAVLVLLAAACAGPSAEETEPDWSAVQFELMQRVVEDQALRNQLTSNESITPELLDRLGSVDADNTAWMKALVTQYGWPTIGRVGAESAGNAWLLVQHADHDVDFQEQCLVLLRAAVEQGQAEGKHLAYLEDRVAMHRGRPQRYGTQFVSQAGGFAPYELEDPERVDEWRAEVGLGSLAEYAERLKRQ